MLYKLWNDNRGGIVTTELLLISSVVVTGLLTGLSSLQSSVESEFVELGQKVQQATSNTAHPVSELPAVEQSTGYTEFYLPEDFEFISER